MHLFSQFYDKIAAPSPPPPFETTQMERPGMSRSLKSSHMAQFQDIHWQSKSWMRIWHNFIGNMGHGAWSMADEPRMVPCRPWASIGMGCTVTRWYVCVALIFFCNWVFDFHDSVRFSWSIFALCWHSSLSSLSLPWSFPLVLVKPSQLCTNLILYFAIQRF